MRSSRSVLVALAGAGLAGSGYGTAGQDRPIFADLSEVYRVGGASAPEWAFFERTLSGRPPPVAFDGAGNLFVLDDPADRVVVIDPRGGLLRTVGRRGEGPGEFIQVWGLAVWRDGRFAVSDMVHSGYHVFSAAGRFERLVKTGVGRDPRVTGRSPKIRIRADPLGNALIARGTNAYNRLSARFRNRLLGIQVDMEDSGIDERGLERLGLDGHVVSVTPILQGSVDKPARAPRAARRRGGKAL